MNSKDILLVERLADAAGEAIRPFFRAAFTHEVKGDASPVTEADRAAEAAMRAILEAERPEDTIIGEEYGTSEGSSGRSWVLDPIDGTVSFMAGRPIFGTLIALMEEGWPLLGVIDQPIARERWLGVVGRATTFNGKPVRTRACPKLADAVLATTGPHYFSADEGDHFMALAAQTAHKHMLMGGDCYNYGLLASGHVDIVCEAGLKLHDIAALVPVVEGAGGRMCDWQGDPLTEDSADDARSGSGASVLALGDPARLDDVLGALHSGH